MATRVKIDDLVASTTRYARRSAAKADKNKNKRLTRTEARSLPKDLRDDFKRQAGTKASVSTEQFAKDQAAYVAAAARRADKNKDGVLTATEARALPASLKENFANYVGAGSGGSGSSGAIRLAAAPAALSALSAQLQTASGGVLSKAVSFKGKPADVAALLADPGKSKTQLNHLLFDATAPGYLRDYPDYYGPDGLTVRTVTSAQAVADATEAYSVDLAHDPAARAAIGRDAKRLIDALAQPGTRLLKLEWTNHDDASFDAVFAINAKSGQIRSAGWWNEP